MFLNVDPGKTKEENFTASAMTLVKCAGVHDVRELETHLRCDEVPQTVCEPAQLLAFLGGEFPTNPVVRNLGFAGLVLCVHTGRLASDPASNYNDVVLVGVNN